MEISRNIEFSSIEISGGAKLHAIIFDLLHQALMVFYRLSLLFDFVIVLQMFKVYQTQ